jgi:hypothetical protein
MIIIYLLLTFITINDNIKSQFIKYKINIYKNDSGVVI